MEKKARSYGPVEFSLDAWIRVFVSEDDLKESTKFDEIIRSDKDLTEKSQLVEELIVELANERLSEASINAEKTFGVKIDIEGVGHEQIASHPINVPDLVEEETADWKELQEYEEEKTKKSSARQEGHFDWKVRYYKGNEVVNVYTIENRTEREAEKEASALFDKSLDCDDWTMTKIEMPKESDFTNNNQDLSNWYNETKPPSESIDRLVDPPKTATDEEGVAVGDTVTLDDFQKGEVVSLNEDGAISVHVADGQQGPVILTFDRGSIVAVFPKENIVTKTWLKKEENQDDAGWKAEPLDERYIEPMGSQIEEE